MQNLKIVTDSSSDILSFDGVDFSSAPLKIITADKEYTDNSELDVKDMVKTLLAYNGSSSTSCPNTDDWLAAFGNSENIVCVTISSALSGSYSSAVSAKEFYEQKNPGRRVFVLDSLSAGPEIRLIAEKIRELAQKVEGFEEICEQIKEYSKRTGLLFMLESMKNLANNGRVNPIAAKAAGLLGIKVIGKASDEGTLSLLSKCRGEDKSIHTIAKILKDEGVSSGKIRISHCLNEQMAIKIRDFLSQSFKGIQTEIYACRGLCSFYAEKGGILIGFEKH